MYCPRLLLFLFAPPPPPCKHSLWHRADLPPDPLRTLRESALSAVGLIIIGRPGLLLSPLRLRLLEHQHSGAGAGGGANPATSAHSRGSGDGGSPEPHTATTTTANGALAGPSSSSGNGLLSGVSVVRVYTNVLREPEGAMAMKSKVLTNLVELLR